MVLAIPAGVALDRYFRPALLAGAWLTALGGAVRLSADTFAAALAGQFLVAVAQPLVLNAVTKVVTVSLPPLARARGISLGTAGIFAGTAIALPLAPALASADSFTPLLLVDLAAAVAAAGADARPARTGPRHGPGRRGRPPGAAAHLGGPADPPVTGVAFLGFDLRRAHHGSLQALLEPVSVSDTEPAGCSRRWSS